MLLAIVRHGKAEAASPTGRDHDRALTPRGLRQALWLGERFAAMLSGLDEPPQILSSDIVRARQTSGALMAVTGWALRFDPRLRTGRPADEAVSVIADAAAEAAPALLLVGHNPQLSDLAAHLLGRSEADVELRTGQAALLEPVEGGPARLLDLLRLDD